MSNSKQNDSNDRIAQIFSRIVVWIFLGTIILVTICDISGSEQLIVFSWNLTSYVVLAIAIVAIVCLIIKNKRNVSLR